MDEMTGKIMKGIAGFYYVDTPRGVYACRARGVFRKDGTKPLVGDDVRMKVVHEGDREGNVERLLPRRSELVRPAVANVDQALVVFAAAKPAPALSLIDRVLISMRRQGIPVILCFNKSDLVSAEQMEALKRIYAGSGCRVRAMSVADGSGLLEVRSLLDGKTTVVAGPSGVGKSSLTNYLKPEASMEVGALSARIDRGKQTTRHTQLEKIGPRTYFLDTPGFSALEVTDVEPGALREYYPEFDRWQPMCYFQDCLHLSEPDCAVQKAVRSGEIAKERYAIYRQIYRELKARKKW